jgi:hypothetical protein
MNLNAIQAKLLEAARNHPPSDQVPYAFEKRIMAQLAAAARPADPVAFWTRMLWRAAVSSVAIMLVASAWIAFAAPSSSSSLSDDLQTTTVYAGLNEINDSP